MYPYHNIPELLLNYITIIIKLILERQSSKQGKIMTDDYKELDEFKSKIIKATEEAIDAGVASDDIVGALEATKLMAFRLLSNKDDKIRDSQVGYR